MPFPPSPKDLSGVTKAEFAALRKHVHAELLPEYRHLLPVSHFDISYDEHNQTVQLLMDGQPADLKYNAVVWLLNSIKNEVGYITSLGVDEYVARSLATRH